MAQAIEAHALSKRYQLGQMQAAYGTLRDSLVRTAGRLTGREAPQERQEIWALRDVSFNVREGEVLGLIGRNGAGKSTLLKILTRITAPTTGHAVIRGRVGSLLEVGTGFNPELTGRENVFLNGSILGMKRREIQRKLPDIVDFAGIDKFIDTPVKRYSSGMYVRLAFSVAAHLEPEILLVDEVLAVGDAEFQQRCLGRMEDFSGTGRTVLFVSHNMQTINQLCNRAIWIERGRLLAAGDVEEVLSTYAASQQTFGGDAAHRTDRLGNGRVQVTETFLREPGGQPTSAVSAGKPMELVVRFAGEDELGRLAVLVTIETLLRERIATVSNALSGDQLTSVPATGELVCSLDGLPLNEGDYMLTVRLEVDGQTADFIADTSRFHVDPAGFYSTRALPGARSGALLLDHRWRLGSD